MATHPKAPYSFPGVYLPHLACSLGFHDIYHVYSVSRQPITPQ